MTLLKQNKITIINKCGAIFDSKLLENAILWYADFPVQRTKYVYKHGRYAAVSIGKEKIHIHRLIMKYIKKEKNLPFNIHIHHKDGNRMNDTLENLLLINAHEHLSLHNKGRKICDSLRAAIIERNHKTKGIRRERRRRDVSPEIVYNLKSEGLSFNKISNMLHIDWSCVRQRYNDYIHDNPELLNNKQYGKENQD